MAAPAAKSIAPRAAARAMALPLLLLASVPPDSGRTVLPSLEELLSSLTWKSKMGKLRFHSKSLLATAR